MTATVSANERQAAIAQLATHLPPGRTVHTILRHVSRSGMSRSISLIIGDENGEPWDVTYLAARAMGARVDRTHGGIRTGGAGMDMGFWLVYSLSRTLYPDGHPCIGDSDDYAHRCPSNDHSNGDRNYGPHTHPDGGYALRQEWL